MMKKLFYTLLLLIGFASVAYSQDRASVTATQGNEALVASKASGKYSFVLPESVTEETVKRSTGYYTSYFTVDYDKTSRTARISLVNDEPESRIVIARFLSSCGTIHVDVDGSQLTINDFIVQYLQ